MAQDDHNAAAPQGFAPPAARTAEPVSPPSRRGRPSPERVEAINRAIIAAAREQFLKAGFDQTPMEAVAAAAKVSKGTLYARYPTKQALLQAVVEEQVAAWSAAAGLNDHLLPSELKARIKYHARTIIRAFASEEVRGFSRLIGGASESSPELLRALHESGYKFALRMLAREIAEGAAAEGAPARNPERVAQMLQAMLWGWHEAEAIDRRVSTQEAEAFADAAVDLIFAARAAW